jgi:hypothetical protein
MRVHLAPALIIIGVKACTVHTAAAVASIKPLSTALSKIEVALSRSKLNVLSAWMPVRRSVQRSILGSSRCRSSCAVHLGFDVLESSSFPEPPLRQGVES